MPRGVVALEAITRSRPARQDLSQRDAWSRARGPVRTSERWPNVATARISVPERLSMPWRCTRAHRASNVALGRDLIMRTRRKGPDAVSSRGLSAARFTLAALGATTVEAVCGIASSGLSPSRALPNGMTPEGDPINRPGDNASRCCPGASSVKQLRAAHRATWRRGDDRHERCNQNYARRPRVSRGWDERGVFFVQAVRFSSSGCVQSCSSPHRSPNPRLDAVLRSIWRRFAPRMCEFCYARVVVATGTRTSAASERRMIHTHLRLPHCMSPNWCAPAESNR